MKTSLALLVLLTSGLPRADDRWTYGSPECGVPVRDIRNLNEIKFPDEPLRTTPAEAAQAALKHFEERFPGVKPPVVESVELRRFPEEYGKDRFFYAVHLRPLSAQSRDFMGDLLQTEKYLVLVPLPFEDTIYTCALRVIESHK